MNLSAFHDYDIRGIYPEEIDEKFYFRLGRAAAAFYCPKKVVVGRDMRQSSPSLYAKLIDGLVESGCHVTGLGMTSTEMFYYASGKYNFDLGITVSASHNPPQYNGAKIVRKGTLPVHSQSGLTQIKQIMETEQWVKTGEKGAFEEKDVFEEWISYALSFIKPGLLKPMKVVVDAGNGMGGPAWQAVTDRLGPVKVIPLYLEPDGRFPHHMADPLKPENLKDLKIAIVKHRADLGLAIDGDADRMFMIDEKGEVLTGTVTSALLADYLLARKKGPILYSVTCGKIVPEIAEKHGVSSIRTRVGHSFIKEKMRAVAGLFAGEHSGHFYFRDNFYAESSLIAGLLALEYLSTSKKPLSQLRAQYDVYPQSGEMNFKVDGSIETILESIKQQHPDAGLIDELDGLTVEYAGYWFNIRASKTEPLLRLNIEGKNKQSLQFCQSELIKELSDLKAVIASR